MFIYKRNGITKFLLLTFLFIVGCIGKIQWIERKGGKSEENNWIPVCPSCKQVVNHEALQCSNPKCKSLLTWSDKVTYAKKLYHEELEEKEGIPAPSSLIEETSKAPLIKIKEKLEKKEENKIKESPKEFKTKENKAISDEKEIADEKESTNEKESTEPKESTNEKESTEQKESTDDWEFNEEDWQE